MGTLTMMIDDYYKFAAESTYNRDNFGQRFAKLT